MKALTGHRIFRALTFAALGMTYLTMLLGGNVIASGAGLSCPDWPTCHGALLGPLAGAAGIEWSHRLSAFALGLTVLALAIVGVIWEARRPVLRSLAVVALGLVVILAMIGGLIIESQLAIVDVLVHFGLATVLFGLLLLLVVLANLREIPRRWIDRAWRASGESPIPPEGPARAAPAGRPSPPVPGTTPWAPDR